MCAPPDQRFCPTLSPHPTPAERTLQGPLLPKLAHFEPPIKIWMMLLGSDPQTPPRISVSGVGIIPVALEIQHSSFITARANAVFSNNTSSPDQSDFPITWDSSFVYIVGCAPQPWRSTPLWANSSLPTNSGEKGRLWTSASSHSSAHHGIARSPEL